MNIVRGGLLSVVMGTGSIACAAQNPTIPFKQMEQAGQLSVRAVPPAEPQIGKACEPVSAMSSSSGALLGPPAYKPPGSLSAGFFWMNGLHLGLAMPDVATTQRCIAVGHCREGNPMMPPSLSGQVAVDSAWVGWGAIVSYKLKKNKSRMWWLTPAIGIAAHAAGTAGGFVNR